MAVPNGGAIVRVVSHCRGEHKRMADTGAGQGWARSSDGTQIGYARGGVGQPLLLVHGTSSDRGRWRQVLPALEARYTVYAVDRRGRGLSGDAPRYAMEREFDDVVAVVDSIGEPVHLLGHSFGGTC